MRFTSTSILHPTTAVQICTSMTEGAYGVFLPQWPDIPTTNSSTKRSLRPNNQGKAMLTSEAFAKKQFICFTRHKTTSLINEDMVCHKLYQLTRHCANDTCSQSSKLQSTHINSSVFTEHPLNTGVLRSTI